MERLKYFLLSIIVNFNCFVLAPVNAQIVNGYGVKIGLTSSSHTWKFSASDTYTNPNYYNGFSIRAFADLLNSSFFNIEAETGISQKGAKLNYQIWILDPYFKTTGVYKTTNNRLNYINASLMGKVKYEMKTFTPYLLLGPQFNYLVGKEIGNGYEVIHSRTWGGFSQFPFKDEYDVLNKNIWGFTAGLGSEFNVYTISFLVEYRYEMDFTNNNYYSTLQIRNYSHSLLAGVRL